MPLLIDGHNLIGTKVIPDISLSDENDEAELVARLLAWSGYYRGKIAVVFDKGAISGRDPILSGGGVDVYWIKPPQTADDYIIRRIHEREPNLIVITNDREIRREAADCHVETWTTKQFVQRMDSLQHKHEYTSTDPGEALNPKQTSNELEELRVLFEREGEDEE